MNHGNSQECATAPRRLRRSTTWSTRLSDCWGRRAEEIAVRDDRRVVNHDDITRAWESMFAEELHTVNAVSMTDAPGNETATHVYEEMLV